MSAETPSASAATCKCGSSWFRLVERSALEGRIGLGAVAFDEVGRVMAHSGPVECVACGEHYDSSAALAVRSVTR